MQLKDAATAMKEMNAKEILGRPVAVDWALDREKYNSLSGKYVQYNLSITDTCEIGLGCL
jgi:hypothetical protein